MVKSGTKLGARSWKPCREERERLAAAVRAAEARTSGEIVLVLRPECRGYRFARALGALIGIGLASFAFALVWLGATGIGASWGWDAIPDWERLATAQVIGAVLGWALSSLPPILRRLVGRAELAAEVHRAACAAFLEHGVTETRERSGVLVFIALLEHRVEILADRGIHAKLGAAAWRPFAERISEGVREGRAAIEIEATLREIGDRLAEHFPRGAEDRNELPDGPRG